MHQVLHFLTDPARAIEEAARVLAPGGRLLVVDFAPHEHEALRDAHAHERLGFSDAQMRQWFKAAGLGTVKARHLAPRSGDGPEKLTVSIWTAVAPGAPPASVKSSNHLERTP
jgi:SAM-dependent methyltransferase